MIALSATHSRDLWYVMRGTGLVSLILLTLTLVAGIVNVQRYATQRLPRAVSALLHRNLALLAVAFLVVHILTAELDTFVKVGWTAVVVPFAAHWSPVWVAAGTIAVDLGVAVVVTSLLRSRLPHWIWRAIHWTAYACWPLAAAHGIGAGTDSGTAWARSVYAVAIGSAVAAVIWRWRRPSAGTLARPGSAAVRPARPRPNRSLPSSVPSTPAYRSATRRLS